MSAPDDEDLAAMRLLQRLVDEGGVEFVSSRGVSALTPAVSRLLPRLTDDPQRGSALADWLLDSVEVRELYVDDERLEQLIRETWDLHEQAQAPKVEARREDLEAMLLREPDQLAHRLVYGDWLQAQCDPFGELIARQVAATGAEVDDYLREHQHELFGPLAEYLGTVVRVDWRAGFIERATVGRPPDDDEPYQGAILLRWLLEHRAAMLLRELTLLPLEHYRGGQLSEMIAALLERPRPLLRRLTVGDPAQWENTSLHDPPMLRELDSKLPALEILELHVRAIELNGLRHPDLRRLEVVTTLYNPNRKFMGVELPRLESLAIGLMSDDVANELAQLELPALRELSTPANNGLGWLERAVWRPQLEALDLSGGNLDDHDAQTLARLSWPRLRRLDVANNHLEAEGVAALTRLCPDVVIGLQRSPDPEPDDDEYYEDTME